MVLGRKYRKYKWAGDLSQLGQLGTFSSGLVDAANPQDQFGYSRTAGLSGALKGAGSGAAIGSALLPGVGTLLGAGIGGIAGLINGGKQNDQAREQEQLYNQMMRRRSINDSNVRLQNYDTLGSNENNIYAKLGGKLKTNGYLATGGYINKISDDNSEVVGNSHEQGGVKLLGQGIELEGKETINESGSEPFAFSDALGFAAKHKKLARMMNKVEQRPYNPISANTLKVLKLKEEGLKMEQEQLKQALGLGTPISQYT